MTRQVWEHARIVYTGRPGDWPKYEFYNPNGKGGWMLQDPHPAIDDGSISSIFDSLVIAMGSDGFELASRTPYGTAGNEGDVLWFKRSWNG